MCRAHFMMDYFKYAAPRTVSSNDRDLIVYTTSHQPMVHAKIFFSPPKTLYATSIVHFNPSPLSFAFNYAPSLLCSPHSGSTKVLKIGPGIEPDKVLVQRFNGSTSLIGGSTGM